MTIMQILQKGRKKFVCVLNPHVDIAIEKEKSSVGFDLDVIIAIEEENFSMCFDKDLQKLHTLYLSNGIYIISGVFMFMEVLCIHFFKHVSWN